mmetsp:Transcript_33335/g.65942  ORF Transcript_33335/g.65942 Transcript_33335/m.65942 type:complete len:130 (+) Transcript_33335:298-687(+)
MTPSILFRSYSDFLISFHLFPFFSPAGIGGCIRGPGEALRQLVVAAIGRYETTLEEDEGLYGEGKLLAFSRHRNAVLVRAGEKHVLRHWKTLCDAALTFLDDVAIEKMDWEGYCKVLDATLGRVVSIAL